MDTFEKIGANFPQAAQTAWNSLAKVELRKTRHEVASSIDEVGAIFVRFQNLSMKPVCGKLICSFTNDPNQKIIVLIDSARESIFQEPIVGEFWEMDITADSGRVIDKDSDEEEEPAYSAHFIQSAGKVTTVMASLRLSSALKESRIQNSTYFHKMVRPFFGY